MSSVKRATITALCVALCAVLPLAFHGLGLGAAFSPLHIPVLLCGLVCGGWYGLFCGVAGPLISSLTTGMPGAPQLVYMIPELVVYGLTAGLLASHLRLRNPTLALYAALIPAMLLGRIVGGLARMIYLKGDYSLSLWLSAYFVSALPGILLHLLLVPVLVLTLRKAGLIAPQTVE